MSYTLTPAQQQATDARKRTLVTAAAGSGKTTVLVQRIVHAIINGEVRPSEVLAVTFTRKAAGEMRSRIAHELRQRGHMQLLGELELATIGTIHSMCSEIVRTYGAEIGVDPRIRLLDEAQDAWVEHEAIIDALEASSDNNDVMWLRSTLDNSKVEDHLRNLRQLASKTRTGVLSFMPVDQISGNADLDVTAADAQRTSLALAALWECFAAKHRQRLQQLNACTFDDIERYALRLVGNDRVIADLKLRWQLLAIDEFQDTNERQVTILDAFGRELWFMVGDEWQSIYRFRGADVDVFRERRHEADVAVIPMRENFRSVKPILDVVNQVFAHESIFGERYEPVLAGSQPQQEVTEPRVNIVCVPEVKRGAELPAGIPHRGRDREALRTAELVAELVESGVPESDIALLYSTRVGVEEFDAALRARGIKTLMHASSGYYDHPDVVDVLSVLRAVRNTHDDLHLLSVLSGPLGRASWNNLYEIIEGSSSERRESDDSSQTPLPSISERALASDDEQIQRAASLINLWREQACDASLVDIVASIVESPQFTVPAASDSDGVRRLANLRRLVDLAASADAIGIRDITAFLQFVDAQQRHARIGEATIADEHVGAVQLMSIHAAKGLEFPHVFLIKQNDSSSRNNVTPSPLLDENRRVHVPVVNAENKVRDTAALGELREAEDALEQDEKMRVHYVAMTRAEQSLTIVGRVKYDDDTLGSPSTKITSAPLCRTLQALELLDDLSNGHGARVVCSNLVMLDERPPQPAPTSALSAATAAAEFPKPLPAPVAPIDASVSEPVDDSRRFALAHRLQALAINDSDDQWRLVTGLQSHDLIAKVLTGIGGGSSQADVIASLPTQSPDIAERVAAIAQAPVFQSLVEHRAQAEVPYVSATGDAGRFDALAVTDDYWWIVDWKSTLPDTGEEAWAEHCRQLIKYAQVATAAGSGPAFITLVAINNLSTTFTWQLDSQNIRDHIDDSIPNICGFPVRALSEPG